MDMVLSNPIEKIREICMKHPMVSERESHGEPTWFVGNRVFVMFANHHHDNRVAIWIPGSEGIQEMFIQTDHTRFFRPPYCGHRGWIGVYLDGIVNLEELEELIECGYRMVAPHKARRELDSSLRSDLPMINE